MTTTATFDAQRVAKFQFNGQDIPWMVDHWAMHQPEHPFIVWEPRSGTERTWTYAEFADATKQVAAGLQARGVTEGDKILIHADNCPEAVIAWYACTRLGAVGVTTNTRSVAAEVSYFISHTGCVGAITQPQYVALVQEAGPDLPWVVVTEDNSGEAAPAEETSHGLDAFDSLYGDADTLKTRVFDPLTPAGILFTSGTTSKPKAVVHTHGNALWAAKVNPTNIDMVKGDVYLAYLPFFHVNTQSWALWSSLGVGGTVILQPKFSASRFWEVILKHNVTHISLIPFVFKAIAADPIPEHTVKVGVFGLIMPELDGWLNMRVMAAYGMTELVTHCVHSNPYENLPRMAMGRVSPGYEMVIVDPDTGEMLTEEGDMGEIWIRGVRGISVFAEYFGNEEATNAMFTEDGWARTGDIVRIIEDGNIVYCDRDKDALKVGGENVSAREVEDVIRTVPGIADLAVVAKEHEMLDMVAVAFIVKADPNQDENELSEQIIAACRENLADFKVPRAVYYIDELPTATLEKVAKNELRDLANSYPTVD